MYENVTYEDILKRMIARVPSDLDRREGSVVYDALAPAAVEIQIMYIELDTILKEMFADTASREYLIKRAAERGITPKPATYAALRGEFNMDIPIGSRFNLETLNYRAVERLEFGVYRMECETIGSEGNSFFGTLVPIEYIKGLTRAELTELLIPGEDEEDTERLRKRYFDSLSSQAFGGNIADYREKVMAVAGVGGVKVFPAWDGGGTVKLVIVNSEYQPPSGQLIQSVKDAVDPEPNEGKGYGIAPIGHVVTVEGAQETEVSVNMSITYQAGYDYARCQEEILQTVEDYLAEQNRTWADAEQMIVRVSRLESRLLDVEGILDVTDTVINGTSGNCVLPANSLAVRGDVSG